MDELLGILTDFGVPYERVDPATVTLKGYGFDWGWAPRFVRVCETWFQARAGDTSETFTEEIDKAVSWAMSFKEVVAIRVDSVKLHIGLGSEDRMFSIRVEDDERGELVSIRVSLATELGNFLLQWLYGQMPVEVIFDYVVENHVS